MYQVGACGRGAARGRVMTLSETGVGLYRMGLVSKPMPPSQVQEIEERALRKLRTGLSTLLQPDGNQHAR